MAYNFDGTNDRITFTALASQSTDISTITIAAWVYPDSTAQFKRHYEMGTSGGAGNTRMRDEMDDGWGWVWVAPFTTTEGKWSTAKPSTGAWIHRCITYNFGATTNDPLIYNDGISQTITERVTPVGTGGIPNTAAAIASTIAGGQYWDGRIAEFAIWNRILTAGEIAALGADNFSPLFFPIGLVLYMPFIRELVELSGGVALTNTESVAIAHPRIIYPSPAQIRRFTTAAAPAAGAIEWPAFMQRGFMNPRFSG